MNMLNRISFLSIIISSSLFIASCGTTNVKLLRDDQIIDILITDGDKPAIKEIVIGGREHSDGEIDGNIKVRSTNGYLKVKTLGILGWWTSITEEKSYEMDRVEKIVYNLRIKDRVDFIIEHLDKDYNSDISDEVLDQVEGKLSKAKSNVMVRDEIGLFAFSKDELLSKLTFKVENEICTNNSIVMSKHSTIFDNKSVLIRIASGHNGLAKFNQFYRAEAEKDYMKAIERFRGILMNNYMGTPFDISKNCPKTFQFDVGINTKANIELETPGSKRSILFDKAVDEVFEINATVKSIDFTGGFMPGVEYHKNDFVATTGEGVVRIQNISAEIINIKSIALFYNKNANEAIYNASILPGQYLDFEIEANKTSKVFFVKNYVGGTITGGINIGYLLGGQKSNAFINIGTRESSVWNKLVMTN
jgi:hypothetical protein